MDVTAQERAVPPNAKPTPAGEPGPKAKAKAKEQRRGSAAASALWL